MIKNALFTVEKVRDRVQRKSADDLVCIVLPIGQLCTAH
jgi:hypothetical protein